MNAPIQAIYQTGATLYAILINPVDGTVYNRTTPGWETYNSTHWSQYAIALTEYTGSGYYRAAYPIASPTVLSTEVVYVQGGVAPSLGDAPASNLMQSQGVNVGAAANSWKAGQNFGAAVGSEQMGTIVGTPPSNILLPTDLTSDQLETYDGGAIIMTSGLLIQQRSFITSYDGAGNLTIQGFPSGGTPASGDTFVIV